MHAAIANHYYDDYDGAGSLHATLPRKAIICIFIMSDTELLVFISGLKFLLNVI
jgi:hypothetical protein